MDGTVAVCSGKHCNVVMTTAVEKEFCKADAKQRARCLEWMKRYAEDGRKLLDKQKFRHEGRFSTGARKERRLPSMRSRLGSSGFTGAW